MNTLEKAGAVVHVDLVDLRVTFQRGSGRRKSVYLSDLDDFVFLKGWFRLDGQGEGVPAFLVCRTEIRRTPAMARPYESPAPPRDCVIRS